MRAWDRDVADLEQALDWDAIWSNVFCASENPNHQYIHLKFCHRAYITPVARHRMGLTDNPYCTFCTPGTLGSFVHVVWECPGIFEFWGKVIRTLNKLMGVQLPMDPFVHLLNDSSKLPDRKNTQNMAGRTDCSQKDYSPALETSPWYLKDTLASEFLGHRLPWIVISKD